MPKKRRTKRSQSSQPELSPATLAKAHSIERSLRAHYERGVEANRQNKGDGKLSAEHLASIHRVNQHTLRKDRDFAERFSEEELDELCRRRRENGLPLHWGYVPTLLSAGSKTKRRKFLRLAVRDNLSVAQLRHKIQAERMRELQAKPRGKNPPSKERLAAPGGRPLRQPKDLESGWLQIRSELQVLVKRCEALCLMAEAGGSEQDAVRAGDLKCGLEALVGSLSQRSTSAGD